MPENKFKAYWGIVAEDKVENSRIAKVYIKEFLPFLDGELDDHDGKEEFKVRDDAGNEEQHEMTTSVHTPCEWAGFMSNRTFPPDLVKGEQVFVFQYGDAENYYWFSTGRNDELRRTEIFRQSVANRQAIGEQLDDANTYFFELDTKYMKRARIIVNNSDGEEFSYGITIDAKNSFVSINDNDGNRIILESKIPRIKLVNKKGTFVDLNAEDIIMVAPRDIIMKAGRQIVKESNNQTNKAATAIVTQAPNVGIEASNVTTKAGTVGVEGAMKVKGHTKLSSVTGESFGTASAGAAYPQSTTNVGAGTGSTHAPAADNSTDGSNRHCAAYEDLQALADHIQQCFSEVNGQIGQPTSHGSISGLAAATKMNKNTGE